MRDATIVDCYEYFQWLTLHHSTSKVVWVIFAGNMPSCRLWPFHLPALRDPTANNDNFNEVLCTIYFPIKRWVYVQGSQMKNDSCSDVCYSMPPCFFSVTPQRGKGGMPTRVHLGQDQTLGEETMGVPPIWGCVQHFQNWMSTGIDTVTQQKYSQTKNVQTNLETWETTTDLSKTCTMKPKTEVCIPPIGLKDHTCLPRFHDHPYHNTPNRTPKLWILILPFVHHSFQWGYNHVFLVGQPARLKHNFSATSI